MSPYWRHQAVSSPSGSWLPKGKLPMRKRPLGPGGSARAGIRDSARRALLLFLFGDPIDFFVDQFLGKSPSLEDILGILDHLRMATKVSHGVGRRKAQRIQILAEHVFDAADFPLPFQIFPGATDRGNVTQPIEFFRESFQLFPISKLPGSASPLQDKQSVFGWTALFGFAPKGAHHAYERSHPGHRRDQVMLLAPAFDIQAEEPLRLTAHQK